MPLEKEIVILLLEFSILRFVAVRLTKSFPLLSSLRFWSARKFPAGAFNQRSSFASLSRRCFARNPPRPVFCSVVFGDAWRLYALVKKPRPFLLLLLLLVGLGGDAVLGAALLPVGLGGVAVLGAALPPVGLGLGAFSVLGAAICVTPVVFAHPGHSLTSLRVFCSIRSKQKSFVRSA
jgi:hypothetical protein